MIITGADYHPSFQEIAFLDGCDFLGYRILRTSDSHAEDLK